MTPKRKAASASLEEADEGDPESDPPHKQSRKETRRVVQAAITPGSHAADMDLVSHGREQEQDAKADSRAVLEDSVEFDIADTTLNVVPTAGGKLLKTVLDGGMQYLLAGARANVGLKSGRYMFEVRIVEALNPAETQCSRGKAPLPRQLVRVGFSVAGSSLVLGDGDGGFCFDSEGYYMGERNRLPVSQRFGRHHAVAVVLNLDSSSPNANTVSLFRDGERACAPQPLPLEIQGKPLFPHVTFRNVALEVNFGPQALKPLPFRCRLLQDAAVSDVTLVRPNLTSGGRHEVVFPVGCPDEGTFPWLDTFLESHPSYVELSDRKILDWAAKSGLWKPRGASRKHSNDKPDFNFGIPSMEDSSVRRAMYSLAAIMPRNYVVMEVKSNLVSSERAQNLRHFSAPRFRKVARVVMGEPPEDFKAFLHKQRCEEKQTKAEVVECQKHPGKQRGKEFSWEQQEVPDRTHQAAVAQGALDDEFKVERNDRQEQTKPIGDVGGDAQDSRQEYQRGLEGTSGSARDPTRSLDQAQDKDTQRTEEQDDVEDHGTIPKVQLTDEENGFWSRTPTISDISSQVLNSAFTDFSIPEKEEGFDDICFEWQDSATSKAYLAKWVQEMKRTSLIEYLQPGPWFRTRLSQWSRLHQTWLQRQKDLTTKRCVQEKRADNSGEGSNSACVRGASTMLDVAPASMDDIYDSGDAEPLFAKFSFEDWALMALRYELFLLVQAFAKDVDDPDRPGMTESNVVFYYGRYFKKQLSPNSFGKRSVPELLDLVQDTVCLDTESGVLISVLPESTDSLEVFLRLAEERRCERQLRIDAGDESARLRFEALQTPVAQVPSTGVPMAAGDVQSILLSRGPTLWQQAPRKTQQGLTD